MIDLTHLWYIEKYFWNLTKVNENANLYIHIKYTYMPNKTEVTKNNNSQIQNNYSEIYSMTCIWRHLTLVGWVVMFLDSRSTVFIFSSWLELLGVVLAIGFPF